VKGVLEIRAGWSFRGGWITHEPAIVVVVADKRSESALARADEARLPTQVGGFPVNVRQAPAMELVEFGNLTRGVEPLFTERTAHPTYQRPAHLSLPRTGARMKVTAHVHGWTTLKRFLAGTRNHLTIGMYDFGARHIRDTLLDELDGNKRMRLLIQFGESIGSGTKKDDLRDQDMVKALADGLGQRFDPRWVSVAQTGSLFASSYHIKVAVRDHDAFWLSSGNWQSSNQPPTVPVRNDIEGNRTLLETYNREWHVIVEHADLARTFEGYINYDYDESNRFVPRGLREHELFEVIELELETAEARRRRDIQVFEPLEIDREVDVQPILTPDDYVEIVLELLDGARRSIYFQNQYINESKDSLASSLTCSPFRTNSRIV
jgi:hypothetical protein